MKLADFPTVTQTVEPWEDGAIMRIEVRHGDKVLVDQFAMPAVDLAAATPGYILHMLGLSLQDLGRTIVRG